ncbi:hypothetical protein M409DRAFT_66714 [Zasmidium cellare ATCC 36951]|uniref:Uncharacterized protein n=1 Tax=Zasmidium cellare ATCC 36951 TaxID=1080233 RepID=A0A6A6CG48_ZASCE|nr:uncharacterized protein M409DRAFT_66714 [Zasmidium cellare ATCC 36951]KAF2166227.1 hypothetical protein M409DRAFT_66714 [Zasmidium cellare ATCC 36951]
MSSRVAPSTAASNAEPPRKRRRLSGEAYGSISERKSGDLETSREVDHMILDFLAYQAINTCFASRQSPPGPDDTSVEEALSQVDESLALFKHRYPSFRFDAEMRFRQQLLQLAVLFTQRLTRNSVTPPTSSLQGLRRNNQARARRWIGSADRVPTAGYPVDPYDRDLPLSNTKFEDNRARALLSLGMPVEDDAYVDNFYGTSECLSLLDLTPLFIKVTATLRDFLGINVGDNWLRLAGEWMLQACLEQYLVYGASGTDAIDEAFAWGHKEESAEDDQQEEDKETNGIFYNDEKDSESSGWEKLKEEMLEELFLAADGTKDLVSGLMELQAAHPIETLEKTVLVYLENLLESVPEPVLVQLEKGKLKDMSEEETKDFMNACGVATSDLF